MVNRTPLGPPEAMLRQAELIERRRQYSYDLTKQLTFFVISAELVFCGYILLNAESLSGVDHSSSLFVLAGLAAIFGVIWRLIYNEEYHAEAHDRRFKKVYQTFLTLSYWGFVGLSLAFFVLLLITGYAYLSGIEEAASAHTISR